jgi:hypothetical protein
MLFDSMLKSSTPSMYASSLSLSASISTPFICTPWTGKLDDIVMINCRMGWDEMGMGWQEDGIVDNNDVDERNVLLSGG